MSEPAHPHQRVPAGRDPVDRRSTRRCSAERRGPGRPPALVDGVTGQTITYAQLAQMVDRMAAGFAEAGVRPGDVVALHSPNTVLYPVVFYAASTRGGHGHDAVGRSTTAKEMAKQLDDSKATLVVTVGALLPVGRRGGRRPAGRGPATRSRATAACRSCSPSTGPVPDVAGRPGRGRRRPAVLVAAPPACPRA